MKIILHQGVAVQGDDGQHLESPHAEEHDVSFALAQELLGEGRAYLAGGWLTRAWRRLVGPPRGAVLLLASDNEEMEFDEVLARRRRMRRASRRAVRAARRPPAGA